ncbi:MAG: ABC transporter permease [Chloroflexi bacterium]|nr:ABC transporter permease [Chloroflexota bacterium]
MTGDRPLIDWAWIADHLDDIVLRTVQHLWLATVAVVAGFIIAMALALLVRRSRVTYGPITAVAGILYTIPALALFAVLVPITGLSLLTAEIPLTIYTLLILIRSNVAGLDSVPADVLEAAQGMGLSGSQQLRRVELPLAVPLIVAGIRLAAVSTIGLVMILSLIGDEFGGLGLFIKEGIQTFFATKIYVGAVLSVTLAFAVDFLFVRLQRSLTPWIDARRVGA